MKRYCLFALLLFSFFAQARTEFRVVFYNVENLFDCDHDSSKNDEEFLPSGLRGWTPTRFYNKIGKIGKVISAIGVDDFPELVGMAEVENAHCLRVLTQSSPLKNARYAFVHEESPDTRGVDVCLLYDRFRFQPLEHQVLKAHFKGEPNKKSRDVLHVKGLIDGRIQLHVFVCHFPSRLGGEAESETYRCQVATQLRASIDVLFESDPNTNVLIMGDFNDYPENRSLRTHLKAQVPKMPKKGESAGLFNLMFQVQGHGQEGTHKNQAEWGFLDQFIVSTGLLPHSKGAKVFKSDFLLQPDDKWLGQKPYRTYNGYRWQGGFSDHLPIWLDLAF